MVLSAQVYDNSRIRACYQYGNHSEGKKCIVQVERAMGSMLEPTSDSQ